MASSDLTIFAAALSVMLGSDYFRELLLGFVHESTFGEGPGPRQALPSLLSIAEHRVSARQMDEQDRQSLQ